MVLTPSDLSQLSAAVQEYVDRREDPETGREVVVLPSLKFFFPAVPKPNEKPKSLTNDQKVQNSIFNRECKKLWQEASKELDIRIEQALAPVQQVTEEANEKSSKEADEKEAKAKSADSAPETTLAPRSLSRVLHDMSIRVLKEWIEEDEDRALLRQKQETDEKVAAAKKSHEQFVRIKDR